MSNWSPDSVAEIAATQRELIDSAFHALAPGGVMVYSTCTLNAQENQQVVRWLLDTYGDAVSVEPLGSLFPGADKALTAEGFLHVFPQIYDSEGFFVARLRKQHAVAPLAKPTYKVGKFPFSPLSGKETALVAQAAAASGLTWGDDSRLWERDKEIWLFPAELEPLFGKVRFSRIGLKLAERFPKGFRWQHEAAIALAGAAANSISSWTPRWPRSGITAAISIRSSHRRATSASSPIRGNLWASPSALAAVSRITCRASWCGMAHWISTCKQYRAGE